MPPSNAVRPLFDTLHHVSLVVQDLEEAVNRLEAVGFGPFVSYGALEDYVELEVPDAAAFRALRIKVCQIGSVALQVIEARGGNTIYGAFRETRGTGIFHLGFQVEEIRLAEAEARKRGLRVLSRGRRPDGSGFSYLDTLDELGVVLLLRQSSGR